MKPSTLLSKGISFVFIGISLVAWILLLANPGHILAVAHCHFSDMGPSTASLQMLLEMNPISSMLTGWGIMVVAMMLPKLIYPVQFIFGVSLKKHRLWLALLFVLSYLSTWMVTGVLIIGMVLTANLLLPGSYLLPLTAGFMVLIWQFSPAKQRCLNHGHDHFTLAAFGWPAYQDTILFGIKHGLWCVGSGWALMLFPMFLPQGHNFAMVAVTFVMIDEHLQHPKFPCWQIRVKSKLMRMLFTQSQMSLKRVFSSNE